MRRLGRTAAAALTFVIAAPCSALACDNWTGLAGNSNWSDSGNWSDGHPPGSVEDACIPANKVINAASIGVRALTLGQGSSISLTTSSAIGLNGGSSSIAGQIVPGTDVALELAGTVSIEPTGAIGSNASGTVLDITGAVTIQGGRAVPDVVALGNPTYVHAGGSLTKTGTGIAKLQGSFDNLGAITASQGELQLAGARIASSGTDTGTYTASGLGTLLIDSPVARTISGAVAGGTVAFGSNAPTFAGPFGVATVQWRGSASPVWLGTDPTTIGTLDLSYGSGGATFNRSADVTHANFAGGTIDGNGTVTIDTLDWQEGTFDGPGNLLLGKPDGSGGATLTADAFHQIRQPAFNRGTITVPAGRGIGITGVGGAFTNQASGKLLLQGAGSHIDGLFKTLVNLGTIEKSDAGNTNFQPKLDNQGETKVTGGTLTMTADAPAQYSGNTLTDGTWSLVNGVLVFPGADITAVAADLLLLDGASAAIRNDSAQDGLRNLASVGAGGTLAVANRTLAAPGALASAGTLRVLAGATLDPVAAVTLSGGRLEGAGTVDAPVTNAGATVAPAGTLSLTSTYAQQAGGTLEVHTGSPADRLGVAGHADFAGTLTVLQHAGAVTADESHTVATFADRAGDFASVSFPTAPAGFAYGRRFDPAALVVTVTGPAVETPTATVTPEPSAPPDHGGGTGATVPAPPATGTIANGAAGADTLVATPKGPPLIGYAGNDKLTASAAGNLLLGGLGNDRLVGGKGKDRLYAGPGKDVALGGAGNDTIGHGVTATAQSTSPPPASSDGTPAPPQLDSGDLLANGHAEQGLFAADATGSPAPPGWTRAKGTATQVLYGTAGGFPTRDRLRFTHKEGPGTVSGAADVDPGYGFFAGGPRTVGNFVAPGRPDEALLTQTVDLSQFSADIDKGYDDIEAHGYLGGYGAQADSVTMLTAPLNVLKQPVVTASGEAQGPGLPGLLVGRGDFTLLIGTASDVPTPKGTRYLRADLRFTGGEGGYLDGYADELRLSLWAARKQTQQDAQESRQKKADAFLGSVFGSSARAAKRVAWKGDGNGYESAIRIHAGKGGYDFPAGLTPSVFDGGAGNDKIFTGFEKLKSGRAPKASFGPGDTVKAGAGNDTIDARNGRADRVDCGRGRDTVIAEKFDRLRGCERIKRAH